MRKLIYLAAPLFSQSERNFNLQLTQRMENFCDVYLPQRDGAILPILINAGMDYPAAAARIFLSDMTALCRCDAVVIVLDGRTIDEGAAFELGRAYGQNKVCVGYHTDFRTLTPWGINLIIDGALHHKFRGESDLIAWVQDFAHPPVQVTPGKLSTEQLDQAQFGRPLHTRGGL